MIYTLGLDLGANSIGWACIDKKSNKITGLGVRVFKEGVARDNKGKEVSKNQARRLARQARRQNERRKQRKDLLIKCLRENNMFPLKESEEENFFKLDPYGLRSDGLYKKLSRFEIGRVLFHLNQRRGFLSSRKSSKEKKETGKMALAITELQKEIEEKECRTLGEYFSRLSRGKDRIRDRYTLRKMYEDELELLWQQQKGFHADLKDELKERLKKIIFYQRPLKSVAKFIGNCSLEPDKKRCRKDSLEAQEFRILEQINRLRYFDDDGVEQKFTQSEAEPLSGHRIEQRDALLQQLGVKKELSFKQIRKLLQLSADSTFNLEEGGKDKVIGNRTGYAFSRVFGKNWLGFSGEEKERIYQTVIAADDEKWLEEYAVSRWKLERDKAQILSSKLRFEQGYMRLSKKAIRKLLPFLREGWGYSDSLVKAGYKTGQNYRSVEEQLKNLRNPIVLKALYELLRIVRNITREFGKPDAVKVELARELKLPAKKRRQIQLENRKREKNNQEICARLVEMGVHPSSEALLRYKLWEECNHKCPYTGKEISFAALFSANPEFQIEHIIPRNRSLDNSFMNKTLCHVEANKRKRDKTPYEAFHGTAQYDEILQRIKSLHFPYPKQRRFAQKEISDDFISRQLNDTAYISREAKTLLQSLGYSVTVGKGQSTAELRYLWGLNSLHRKDSGLPDVKNREDHRHHAIDAAVVAMTDAPMLRRLSFYNQYAIRTSDRMPSSPHGWKNFREALGPFVKRILVSHQITKRARGALHEETFYGVTGRRNKHKRPLYAVRKPLNELTAPMIDRIIDPVVKEIVKDHLRFLGVDTDTPSFKIPSTAFKECLYMKTNSNKKIPIKKVRIQKASNKMFLLTKLNKTAVEPGNNHHMVIFREKGKQKGQVCTLFEAARRAKKGEPIIKRNLGEGKEFMCSLSENEMVLSGIDEADVDWKNPDHDALSPCLFRVQKISDKITLRHHLVARLKDDAGRAPGLSEHLPGAFKGFKVRIDRIGRIAKAHD